MKRLKLQPMVLRAGVLAVISALPVSAWAAVAGQFQFVSGDVRVIGSDGRERLASKGADISEGETIVTGSVASAQLKMIDGGILALRPDSRLQMTTYTFKGREDGSEKASMSLIKGGLRAISGLIGKTNKQNYAINTPTATIGIRGTDHEPVVIPPPPPGQAPANPPGTYDKVNVGATTLTTQAGTTVINPNQVGFAGAPNAPPVLLPRVPNFYQVTPPPAPGRSQQAPDAAGNQPDSGSQNAQSGNDTPGTTTAGSGDGTGDAMRVGGQANASAPDLPAAGGSGSASLTPNVGSSGTSGTPGAGGTTPGSQTRVTGVNASGTILDATNQETEDANGNKSPLQDIATAIPNRSGSYDYLSAVLTGTAEYNMVGGTDPTNANGLTGTLQSAKLDVNFSTKLADAQVGLQFAGDAWELKSERMVLHDTSFSSNRIECSAYPCGLTINKNGSWANASGELDGSLTGASLSGATIRYNFTEHEYVALAAGGDGVTTLMMPSETLNIPVSGTVQLAGPAQSLTTPWRGVGISTGWHGGQQSSYILDDYGHQVLNVADYRGLIDGADGPAGIVEIDSGGRLTQFAGRAALLNAEHSRDALIRHGTANVLTGGSTTLGEVKVSWGRWESGSINIYSRDGANLLGSIDNTNRSLHWLATDILTGPITTLPVTGSATYTLAGHTLPTDMNGQQGVLASATLAANFSEMKVDAAVVVNMGIGSAMTTLGTAATGMHLKAAGGFGSGSGSSLGAASHTASCHGPACGGGQVQGYINGTFLGTGAAGAAMAYGIVSGPAQGVTAGPPGTAVTGVAVFKK